MYEITVFELVISIAGAIVIMAYLAKKANREMFEQMSADIGEEKAREIRG